MATHTILILGSTGQDGSLISKSLLEKGHQVIALTRGDSEGCENFRKLEIEKDICLINCDINSFSALSKIIEKYNPRTIFNLACQSSVGKSFSKPAETTESIVNVSLNILEIARKINYQGRMFFAGSSEMFGDIEDKANIDYPQQPNSPYAIAKQASFNLVKMYRELYNLNCMTGILFNHESNLRPQGFVTQKIIKTAKEIYKNQQKKLIVGNIDIIRDWGWAPEYINAIQLISESSIIKDYVICTGRATSLKMFIQKVFSKLGLDWEEFTVINRDLFRASDIKRSCGDPKPLFDELGWEAKVNIDLIIERMLFP
ncbi:GDP-mannose 4,6-dehydratase [Prochlorococcus marinus XMU1403]|uniref:GDP-mannose 4,6-dehydratase n=1 Tax=Prochlorococcus marinus TaxID=1219 RepID=UPI000D87177D|nr:GDP-mannose 4,6-dehydratase [Prochlorococcus marinus]MBW3050286.1 GDP-mannose 4,6-dehydratase [Prochlorococcus marinus str. MU1403]PYE00472.1 GDP-mannose 4,6-dehydratase [Prochlorococcus marinus XMU1403]